jgi:hypothetical protein
VARSNVCDVKVMEDFGSSLEWMALGIEWTIKLVMLGISSVAILAVVGCCVIILHKIKINSF